ncbi:uncharacterized protein [Linepithema humile]|uniref:uncharacterized protein n=1 Tax=Linepithema humile TaxID=83485 RepID=UPI00351EB208
MQRNVQKILFFETMLKVTLESTDEESSDSESDLAEIIYDYYERKSKIPKIRCKNYIEDVVWQYTDVDFKSHFRLSRPTFRILLELLSEQLSNKFEGCGRHTISPEKTLLLAIWMMGTPNSYRCVADRFDVGKGTAWRCVGKVVNALYLHLDKFITWPNREKAEEIWTCIKNRYKFPKVIGAIDGTHIKIATPKLHPEAYINRKGYHSIQLQVICDHELKFTHVYAGQVGSVHDMRVFRLSGFENLCTEQHFSENSHLLGDAAYSIQKCIMVPFKDNGHLTNAQITYNTRLSQARMMIERAIGLLKGRFRSLLDTLPMRRTDLIPKYIVACCILHNICINHDDYIDVPVIVQNECLQNVAQNVIQGLREEGVEKRNTIMYYLQNENYNL